MATQPQGRIEPRQSLRETLRLIRTDIDRYRWAGAHQESLLGALLLSQGLWASTVYRFNHWLHRCLPLGPLRTLVRIPMVLSMKAMEVVSGFSLPPETEVGEGLYLGHYGPTLLHPRGKIGNNCNFSQGVSVGGRQTAEGRPLVPVVGHRVYVGPNAVIVGDVEIGDDAAVGAGAVVVKSVPPGVTVGGNPAREISRRGAFDLVRYRGMEQDPARREALDRHHQSTDLQTEGGPAP